MTIKTREAEERLEGFILIFSQLPKFDPSLKDVVDNSLPDLREILALIQEADDGNE